MSAIPIRHELYGASDKPLFQVFFLKDDKDQSVRVAEVEEIDFEEVKAYIERGDAVFISRVHKNLNYTENRKLTRRLVAP